MTGEQMGGVGAVLADEIDRATVAGTDARTVILVEGVSDQRAIEALAVRRGRDFEADGVTVIPIAGATNIGRFLGILGPEGYDVRLAGLCDEAEEEQFMQALEETGIASDLDRAGLERLGFFVCTTDLEDELIRALGRDRMLDLMQSQGDMRRFRSFQNQPAQRHKTIDQQIPRWLGNHKIRYASLMVNALDLEDLPWPMEGLLRHI